MPWTRTIAVASFLATVLFPTRSFATSFTMIGIQNEIIGAVGGVSTFQPYNQFFDIISTGAISETVHDTNIYAPDSIAGQHPEKGFASASADFASLAVSLNQTSGGGETIAEAFETVWFTSDVSGVLGGLLFNGDEPSESAFSGPRAAWTITDMTTNTVLWNDQPGVRGAFSKGLTDDFGSPLAPLVFSASDVYKLQMYVQTGSNQGPDEGDIATNLFSLNVPEPSSLGLFGVGLFAVLLSRRRRVSK